MVVSQRRAFAPCSTVGFSLLRTRFLSIVAVAILVSEKWCVWCWEASASRMALLVHGGGVSSPLHLLGRGPYGIEDSG